MTNVVNLKGVRLKATACGGCSGSSSDAKFRTNNEDKKTPVAAAAATFEE